jgi:hypothetical protein
MAASYFAKTEKGSEPAKEERIPMLSEKLLVAQRVCS